MLYEILWNQFYFKCFKHTLSIYVSGSPIKHAYFLTYESLHYGWLKLIFPVTACFILPIWEKGGFFILLYKGISRMEFLFLPFLYPQAFTLLLLKSVTIRNRVCFLLYVGLTPVTSEEWTVNRS